MNNLTISEWLKIMGYNRDVPKSIKSVANSYTTVVWEQLATNVMPKQNVDCYRKNIICNKVAKGSKSDGMLLGPINEINLYNKVRKLECEVQRLQGENLEIGNKVDSILRSNNTKYLRLETLKKSQQTSRETLFLYENKRKAFSNEIEHIDDLITKAKNLTPVEVEASENHHNISELLQKCADKLEKMVQKESTDPFSSIKKSKQQKTPKMCEKENKQNLRLPNKSRAFFPLRETQNIFRTSTGKPRESLGILSDDYFNFDDDEEEFLTFSPLKSTSSLGVLSETTLNDSFNNCNDTCMEFDLNGTVKEILYKNNRFLIWENLSKLRDCLRTELEDCVSLNDKISRKKAKIDDFTVANLHKIHVITELEAIKIQNHSKKLLIQLENSIKQMADLQFESSDKAEFLECFELKVKIARLESVINFIRKEISSHEKMHPKSNELEIAAINSKTKQAKITLAEEAKLIQDTTMAINSITFKISYNCDLTASNISKINNFIYDFDWATPLETKNNVQELEIFKNFPLAFNKRFVHTNENVYYRNLIGDFKLSENNSDIEKYVMEKIIRNPSTLPEIVLTNVLKQKIKLSILKKVKGTDLDFQFKTFTKEEFKVKENYTSESYNSLNAFLYSSKSKLIMSMVPESKRTMDLWLNQPFTDCISPKLLYQDCSYEDWKRRFLHHKSAFLSA